MAEPFKLEVVAETDPASPEASQGKPLDTIGFEMLRMGLKALSQRALIALSACFTLITVASAFWLFMSRTSLDTMQLVLCGMYAIFVLAANVIVRR